MSQRRSEKEGRIPLYYVSLIIFLFTQFCNRTMIKYCPHINRVCLYIFKFWKSLTLIATGASQLPPTFLFPTLSSMSFGPFATLHLLVPAANEACLVKARLGLVFTQSHGTPKSLFAALLGIAGLQVCCRNKRNRREGGGGGRQRLFSFI